MFFYIFRFAYQCESFYYIMFIYEYMSNITTYECNNFGWKIASIEDTRQLSSQDDLRSIKDVIQNSKEKEAFCTNNQVSSRGACSLLRGAIHKTGPMILQKIYRSRLSRAPSQTGSAATVHTTGHIVEDSVRISESLQKARATVLQVAIANDQEKIDVKLARQLLKRFVVESSPLMRRRGKNSILGKTT